MAKNKNELNYTKKLKIVKSFFDIKINKKEKNLTRSEKWQISYYFNTLKNVHAINKHGQLGKVRVFRSKDKTKIEKLKKDYGFNIKKMKVVPIPVKTVSKNTRVRVNKENIKFYSKHYNKTLFPINYKKYLFLDESEIYKKLRSLLYGKKLKGGYYSIKVGLYEKGISKDIKALAYNLYTFLMAYDGQKSESFNISSPQAVVYKKERGRSMAELIDGIYYTITKNQVKLTVKEERALNGKKRKKKNRGRGLRN